MTSPSALTWLSSPALAGLWTQIRARLQRNGRQARGVVTVDCVDHDAREAVAQLLSRTAVGAQIRVDLAVLDGILRASAAALGLVEVVELLGGPVRDRPAEIAAARDRQAVLRADATAALDAVGLDPSGWAGDWLELLWRRTSPSVLASAAAVLALLFDGRIWSRGELAERVTGTAHGLDDDLPLTRVVLRGIALATSSVADVPAGAAGRREVWESVGVLGDTVTTSALTYGLRPVGNGWRCAQLRERAEHHVETHLNLRELRQLLPLTMQPQQVYVCENPRVLEAAAESAATAAVICTLGNPSVVVLALLDALASVPGVRLTYHGDFDWPGIAIAGRVMRRTGATPWRFAASDYRAAVRAAAAHGTPPLPLHGDPAATPWDPDLAVAMRAEGVAVHEERIIDTLMADLTS